MLLATSRAEQAYAGDSSAFMPKLTPYNVSLGHCLQQIFRGVKRLMRQQRTDKPTREAREAETCFRKPLRPLNKVQKACCSITAPGKAGIAPPSALSWTIPVQTTTPTLLTLEERGHMRDIRILNLVRDVVPPSPARLTEICDTCKLFRPIRNIPQGPGHYTTLGSRASRSIVSQDSGVFLREHEYS